MKQKKIIKFNNEVIDAPQEELFDSLEVEAIHTFYYYRFAPSFDFPGEKHDYYELFYVVKGNMVAKTDVGDFYLKEKEYFICAPNVFHSMVPDKSYASCYSLSFSAKNIKDAITMSIGTINEQELGLLELIAHDYVNNLQNDGYLTPIYSLKKDEFAYRQLIKNSLETLLILFTRNHLSESDLKNSNHPEDSKLIISINEYVSEHYQEKITLDDMAKELNYSSGYLCRAFSKYTGISFMEFITKFRIRKSLELFASEQNYSVSKVATLVGFSDPYYFSKIFKKMTGMSPNHYIKYTQDTHIMNTHFVLTDILT